MQKLYPKAAEQTAEQQAELAQAIVKKQDPIRRVQVDLDLPSAAACAAWLREQENPVPVGRRLTPAVADREEEDDFPVLESIEEAEEHHGICVLELQAAEAFEGAAINKQIRASRSLLRVGDRPDPYYLAGVDLVAKLKEFTPALEAKRKGELARWVSAMKKARDAEVDAKDASFNVKVAASKLKWAEQHLELHLKNELALKNELEEVERQFERTLTRERLYADADYVWGEGWRERSGVAPAEVAPAGVQGARLPAEQHRGGT